MHVQTYPQSYNDPAWETIFLSLDDAEVGKACQAWFEQWCNVPNVYQLGSGPFFQCMPALHALSNRVTANIDCFIDDLENEELSQKPGYLFGRGFLTRALAPLGWEGFAMRCWTDSRAYAGFLQHIEREGIYECIDDLAFYPHAGKNLQKALDLYGEHLPYPWIGAACIRWAIFGRNTSLVELPHSVQWLKALYSPRQQKYYWDVSEAIGENIDFGQHAPVISVLLLSPQVWMHMMLQEGKGQNDWETEYLWLHWASSIGHPCERELDYCKEGNMLALRNCILQGDGVELEIMRLGTPYAYLLQKAKGKNRPLEPMFELPTEDGCAP